MHTGIASPYGYENVLPFSLEFSKDNGNVIVEFTDNTQKITEIRNAPYNKIKDGEEASVSQEFGGQHFTRSPNNVFLGTMIYAPTNSKIDCTFFADTFLDDFVSNALITNDSTSQEIISAFAKIQQDVCENASDFITQGNQKMAALVEKTKNG